MTCNATWIESQGQPDYGMAFWRLEECVRQQSGYTNTSDPILCYPKNDVRSRGLRTEGPSKMGLGLLVVLGFLMFST
jgi:hypothetical protein